MGSSSSCSKLRQYGHNETSRSDNTAVGWPVPRNMTPRRTDSCIKWQPDRDDREQFLAGVDLFLAGTATVR
jgi:hypothetical protein